MPTGYINFRSSVPVSGNSCIVFECNHSKSRYISINALTSKDDVYSVNTDFYNCLNLVSQLTGTDGRKQRDVCLCAHRVDLKTNIPRVKVKFCLDPVVTP